MDNLSHLDSDKERKWEGANDQDYRYQPAQCSLDALEFFFPHRITQKTSLL